MTEFGLDCWYDKKKYVLFFLFSYFLSFYSSQYLSLPMMSLSLALKITKVEMDLIQDIDQYIFLEKALQGELVNQYTVY